jgi:hypothetical protein
MCIDCVLASPRIAQDDPGRRTPPRGGSVIVHNFQLVHQRISLSTCVIFNPCSNFAEAFSFYGFLFMGSF